MMKDIAFSVIEIFISLVVESFILGSIFAWISNKAGEKMEQNLADEMKIIEDQTKTVYEQLQQEIRQAKTEIISEIKESSANG